MPHARLSTATSTLVIAEPSWTPWEKDDEPLTTHGVREQDTMSTLNPYLAFRDTAKEALEFYQGVFGGDLTLSTFGEFHATEDPAEVDKIMHGRLTTASGFTLMAADVPNVMSYNPGDNISISISADSDEEAELRRYWDALAADGQVGEQFDLAPWGDYFGQLQDKHGIYWMFNVAGPGDAGQYEGAQATESAQA
jgi:PhnB protein